MHQRPTAIDGLSKLKHLHGENDRTRREHQTNLDWTLYLATSPFSYSLLIHEIRVFPLPTTDGLLHMSPNL